jgi:hypothetical protein
MIRPFEPTMLRRNIAIILIAMFGLIGACAAPQVSQAEVSISAVIEADGTSRAISVPSGSTVEEALQETGFGISGLDRTDPPLYTIVQDGGTITITRIREETVPAEEVIPFIQRKIYDESRHDDEPRIIAGSTGLREIRIRNVYENDVLVSSAQVGAPVVIKEPQEQLMIIARQSPFMQIDIPGKLVYISRGAAYLMEGSTKSRVLLMTHPSNDDPRELDGRVFSLSSDGKWLLYTVKSKTPESEINNLYALNILENKKPINLKVGNVVHFAAWVPGSKLTVAFSTVEPTSAAPGWQANNNVVKMLFAENGNLGVKVEVLEANNGGVYGWWGSTFAYSPNGGNIAYARPDGVGLVDQKDGSLINLLDITPFKTGSDWAFVSGMTWGADGRTLFVVTHAPPTGLIDPEESPYFDLHAISIENGANVRLVTGSGMFAYPASSPLRLRGSEKSYRIAFLKAILPAQSDTSGYRLMIMDRDGSEQRVLFPPEGSPGLKPQTPLWAPFPLSEQEGDFVAVIYQNNLWLIDTATGTAHQITGDNLITKLDWK